MEILDAPVPARVLAVAAEGPVAGDPPPSPIVVGDIVLAGVSVVFQGRSEPALAGVDLVLAAGRRTAIVGPSGAGKSTLAGLLLRFLEPDEGRITVGGGIGRARARDWRARSHRCPSVPPVPWQRRGQHPARPARRDGRGGRRAAAAADAAAFIDDLPQGYATPIGEDGVRLSGGQRQRIAIARAFLRDADLVVLDEPTSHLDADAEAAIGEAIDRLGRGRTVVVITHRHWLAACADAVTELAHGRVVR